MDDETINKIAKIVAKAIIISGLFFILFGLFIAWTVPICNLVVEIWISYENLSLEWFLGATGLMKLLVGWIIYATVIMREKED